MSVDQAIQAQAIHQETLLAKSNVVGVAVGFKESEGVKTDTVSVVVLVQQKKPLAALTAQDVIPKELEGMKTDVYEVGYLRAQDTPRDRFRPMMPGISIGHYKVTAGTFGALVKDKATGSLLILSNNHVLANCNDALVGDSILQPGSIDGGTDADVVARLERFISLKFTDDIPGTTPGTPGTPGTPATGCDILSVLVNLLNLLSSVLGSGSQVAVQPKTAQQAAAAVVPDNTVDCAVAKPLDPSMVTNAIRGIGPVTATKPAALGMHVRKTGRTTDTTEGNINLLNATVNIAYDTARGEKTARFTGQMIADPMSQGGDSGSLIVDAIEDKAVGILFGGSALATIMTPIDAVLDALGVTLA